MLASSVRLAGRREARVAVLLAAGLLAGCTGYSPPPQAVLNCQNTDHVGGDFEYLNCIRGQTQVVNHPLAQAGQPGAMPRQP